MTALPPGAVDDAEREVDLLALGRAILGLWWIVALGVLGGIILGLLYAVSAGSLYEASARVAPGQAFNPSGSSAVLTYLTNKTAVNEIATSEATLQETAAKTGIPISELRNHVFTEAVTEGGVSAGRAVLIDISAQNAKARKAEEAADTVARIVQRTTTSDYVRQAISIYGIRIKNFTTRLRTLQQRVELLDEALREPNLTLNERLLLAIQLDQAQATQGQTIDSLTTAQQQQILAQDVSQTQIIQEAKAAKLKARSRRTSVVFGAAIGFIVGLVAAIVVHYRWPRTQVA